MKPFVGRIGAEASYETPQSDFEHWPMFPSALDCFQCKVVSKDPSGIPVVEIAVNDCPKAVSIRQKQLDMTHVCGYWDRAKQLYY